LWVIDSNEHSQKYPIQAMNVLKVTRCVYDHLSCLSNSTKRLLLDARRVC
jgi:hypothetical protein